MRGVSSMVSSRRSAVANFCRVVSVALIPPFSRRATAAWPVDIRRAKCVRLTPAAYNGFRGPSSPTLMARWAEASASLEFGSLSACHGLDALVAKIFDSSASH